MGFIGAGVPGYIWHEAVRCAAYILGRRSPGDTESPEVVCRA